MQIPRKYERGDEVYEQNRYDHRGRQVYTRRWICGCYKWNKRQKVWWYKLKDAHGKWVGWVSERELELMGA